MSNRPERPPIENAWWVVPGSLLAGPYPGTPDRRVLRERLIALINAGVRTFLNLQQPLESSESGRFADYAEELDRVADERGLEFQLVRVPCEDRNVPSVAAMAFALDVVDAALARGWGVYAHCHGGHGRTGTLVGCWLRRQGLDGEAALAKIAALREGCVDPSKGSAPQTAGQFAFVRQWREPGSQRAAAEPRGEPDAGRGADGELESFIAATGLQRASADEVPRFALVLGGSYASGAGHRRTVEACAFDARGLRRYVVRGEGGALMDKGAEKAEREYRRLGDAPAATGVVLREPDPGSLADRYQGTLVGLAVGDALGAQVEFEREGHFAKVTELVGGGPFKLPAGAWTDDTSLALCLAESLVERKAFDPIDQLDRYLRWYREGHLSSTGTAFDVGGATRSALERFSRTREARAAEPAAGNGSLMRLAPVPLAFAALPERAVELAGESSRTTHDTPEAIDACRYCAGLLVGALEGRGKEELLSELFSPSREAWGYLQLCPEIDGIARGSFKRAAPPQFRTSMGADVVESLEIALWAYWSTSSFEDGAIAVVNMGRDTDTYGAIYGMLAGAFYGYRAIPERWRARLVKRDLIRSYAQRLLEVREAL